MYISLLRSDADKLGKSKNPQGSIFITPNEFGGLKANDTAQPRSGLNTPEIHAANKFNPLPGLLVFGLPASPRVSHGVMYLSLLRSFAAKTLLSEEICNCVH
jgi:hypothetical protein